MEEKSYNYTPIERKRMRVQVEVDKEQNVQKDILEKGDKVILLEHGEEAIVYQPRTQYSSLVVFYKNEMIEVDEKRVKLSIRGRELYPADYDLETLFISFKERKLEHDIARGSKKALRKIQKETRVR